jgi:phosphatidylglycerol:prolipoprotein diacylglycerol transferase
MAPFLALGQGLGRIGCFLNGCCYGVVMDDRLPGVIFPGESCTRFPTQIVSTLGLIFIYVVLRAMLEKGVLRNRLFYAYLIFYSVLRFFVEFFRGDVAHATFGMTVSQVICIGIFIGGAAAMILRSFVWKSSSSK